ncbi:TSUP family transporter [Octadecabacter sp. R77987]|uniref:TSUP family transporter n=1 Tax=Octadecabacter sp. R77987 TaxID=3093874 RepID=UPI00366CDBC8
MDIALILVAAFGAGVLNTIAGGGTFLTFPALVFIGVPPVMANATSAVAVFPGYLGGALGFRGELAKFDRKQMIRLTVITLIAAVGFTMCAVFFWRLL